jgi:hypothetical protein
MPARSSDRWVTPGVVIATVLMAGLLLSVIAAGVAYLAARGVDPDPMLQLVAQITTAVGALGTLVLQLANRATVAKTERNTGQLVSVVADAVAPPAPAAAAPPAYVVDLDDEDDRTAHRVAVPPLPAYPQHTRHRQDSPR